MDALILDLKPSFSLKEIKHESALISISPGWNMELITLVGQDIRN